MGNLWSCILIKVRFSLMGLIFARLRFQNKTPGPNFLKIFSTKKLFGADLRQHLVKFRSLICTHQRFRLDPCTVIRRNKTPLLVPKSWFESHKKGKFFP